MEAHRLPEGGYDPAEFEHLEVSKDILELFDYITAVQPRNIDLSTTFKPFILDYIPAIGDTDPLIKVFSPLLIYCALSKCGWLGEI